MDTGKYSLPVHYISKCIKLKKKIDWQGKVTFIYKIMAANECIGQVCRKNDSFQKKKLWSGFLTKGKEQSETLIQYNSYFIKRSWQFL